MTDGAKFVLAEGLRWRSARFAQVARRLVGRSDFVENNIQRAAADEQLRLEHPSGLILGQAIARPTELGRAKQDEISPLQSREISPSDAPIRLFLGACK
jgi:hypothetical protein